MKKELTFKLDRKNLLNANTMSGLHYHAKGKIASNLRSLSYNEGVKELDSDSLKLVEERKKVMDSEANNSIFKSKVVKQLKKANPSLSKKELDSLVAEEMVKSGMLLDDSSSNYSINPLFNHFRVIVTVYSPTKRRVDPPNFSPTIKHLVDGLTDAGWWIDDSWEYLEEMTFRYGGLSEVKDTFIFKLTIEEV